MKKFRWVWTILIVLLSFFLVRSASYEYRCSCNIPENTFGGFKSILFKNNDNFSCSNPVDTCKEVISIPVEYILLALIIDGAVIYSLFKRE